MTTVLTDTRTFTDRGIAAQADRTRHLAVASGRPHLAEDDLVVAWQANAGWYANAAVVLAQPADWEAVLERIAAVIPESAPATIMSPFAVPDLSPAGWHLIGHPPFMVRPAGVPALAPPPELTVTEVADRDGLEVFECTLVDSYPMEDLQPYRWGQYLHQDVLGGRSRFFVGWVAGEPVGTAAVHIDAGVNLVEFIATAPAARGRGYGEILTWQATLADPSLPAVLIASDLGRPVYERMGYLPVSRWTLWTRPA